MSLQTERAHAAALTQPTATTITQVAVRYPDGTVQFCHDIVSGLSVMDSLVASGASGQVVRPEAKVTTTARRQAEMLVERFGGEVLTRTVVIGEFVPAG